jgi:hypothetical protein
MLAGASAEVNFLSSNKALFPGKKAHRYLLVIAAAFSMAACAAAPRAYVDTADEAFACSRFGWLDHDRPASIAEQRVRAEAMRALEAKGYAVESESPDCLVSGVIFTGARPASPVSLGVGAGRWGGRSGGSIGVSVPVGGGARTVGNLAIDVIDVERNAEVWRGTLEGAFRTPDPTSDQVGDAVQKLLERFPARQPG